MNENTLKTAQVKRFACQYRNGGLYEITEWPDGSYVLYSDFKSVVESNDALVKIGKHRLARIAALEAQVKRLEDDLQNVAQNKYKTVKSAEVTRLEAQVQKLREACQLAVDAIGPKPFVPNEDLREAWVALLAALGVDSVLKARAALQPKDKDA